VAALAKETLAQDPFCGAVLVFRSRRAGAGKALVGRDDGLALRIMSGDDAAYFECHGFPPL
jgi:hypothetical protein